MIPVKIEARPNDDGFRGKSDPDVLPLPGVARRPERDTAARSAVADEIGPRDLANALRYHSVLFVTLGSILATALAASVWSLVPAKYTTYAMILVEQREPTVLPNAATGDQRNDFVTFLKTQAGVLKSGPTIRAALRDPRIANLKIVRDQEHPEAFFEEEIKPDFSPESQIIKVSLTGSEPGEITELLNTIVDKYLENYKQDSQFKHYQLEKLRTNKTQIETELDAKEKNFEQIFSLTPTAMTTKNRLRLDAFMRYQTQHKDIALQLTLAREHAKAAEEKLAGADTAPLTLPDLSARIEADPAVRATALATDYAQRAFDSYRSRKSNPDDEVARDMRRRLEQQRTQLEALRQGFRAKVEAEYRSAQKMDLTNRAESARAQVKALETIEKGIAGHLASDEFKNIDAETGAKPMTAEQRKLWDDIARYREQLARIDSTMIQQRINLDSPDRVRRYLGQRAEIPTKREIKKPLALSGAAGLLGFGLVGGGIGVVELRRKRVFSPKDPLFTSGRLSLMGVIPELAAGRVGTDSGRPSATDDLGQAFVAAVDKVKTVLHRQMQKRRVQVLLITSAAPAEGKSALAWHLALSCARSDRRTLFIDANLRRPGLAAHCEVAASPGLSEALRGEKPVQQVVQRTALENLWCVAAGESDTAARQVLDTDALRRLLDRTRQDFDCVIIDTCAIGDAVDPLYLAQRADATLLSVRTFRSRVGAVERAVQRLGLLGTPVLGAVLTDAAGAAYEV